MELFPPCLWVFHPYFIIILSADYLNHAVVGLFLPSMETLVHLLLVSECIHALTPEIFLLAE